MYISDVARIILVTNNSMVIEKYEEKLNVRSAGSYEEVLVKTRDLIYGGCALLTHPQASSLKPNQTPVRSVMLSSQNEDGESARDCMLIENAIEGYNKWQRMSPSPEVYPQSIIDDFETIDLSMIDGVVAQMDLI